MSEKDKCYEDTKSVISTLFVLKESSKTGMYHTETSDDNQMWFHGAAAMLNNSIPRLQNLLRAMNEGVITSQGGKQMSGKVYNSVEEVASKLFVLKDSCKSMYLSEKSEQEAVWYQGAAAILKEGVEKLQEALQAISESIVVDAAEELKATDSDNDIEDKPPVKKTETVK